METEKEIINEIKRKNAEKMSLKEGAASSVMSGLGDSYISAFMVEMTRNPVTIGLLSSIPGLLSPFAQIFGSKMMERKTRKEIVTLSVLLHALMWIPISLIALLFYFGVLRMEGPYFLLIAYSILAIMGSVAGPAWFSWMGDIAPEKERGKYFSKRNRIAGAVSLSVFLLASFFLDYFKTRGFVMLAFMVMFLIASTFRLIALSYFKRQYEPEFKLNKEYYFTFFQYIRRYGNFVKFGVYQATFYFALMIAGPFFTVYMLKELNFNYLTYTVVSISSTLFYLLFLPLAGKFSDKYGNVKMLFISSLGFASYPFLWIFIDKPVILIFVPQLIIGAASAGFAISTTNFIYETVSPQRRGICNAYMSVLIGLGIFLESIVGGLIVKYSNFGFLKPILVAFGVSALLRFLVTITFIPQIKENERTAKAPKIRFDFWNLTKFVTEGGRGLKEIIQQTSSNIFPFYKKAEKVKEEE